MMDRAGIQIRFYLSENGKASDIREHNVRGTCRMVSFRLSTLEKPEPWSFFPRRISSISMSTGPERLQDFFSTMSFFPITALVICHDSSPICFQSYFPLTRISHNCSVSSDYDKNHKKSPSAMGFLRAPRFGIFMPKHLAEQWLLNI